MTGGTQYFTRSQTINRYDSDEQIKLNELRLIKSESIEFRRKCNDDNCGQYANKYRREKNHSTKNNYYDNDYNSVNNRTSFNEYFNFFDYLLKKTYH